MLERTFFHIECFDNNFDEHSFTFIIIVWLTIVCFNNRIDYIAFYFCVWFCLTDNSEYILYN